MEAKRYDLIVIGGGAAGEKGAAQVAHFGKSVAVVERGIHLGGATAGTTVPSKTLRETHLCFFPCFNYPTHGELYKYATYDALDKRARIRKSADGSCKATLRRH